MDSLIDKIPEILEKSGTLFSFFALMVLVIAFLSYVFYIKAEKAERNRAFVLILLFFFGLVLAALVAGTFSGFQRGREATTERVSQNPGLVDPSLVKLSPDSIRKIEDHITSKGEGIIEERKTRVLEEALESYTNPQQSLPSPTSSPTSIPLPSSSLTPKGGITDFQSKVSDFLFVLEGCYRSGQNVSCRLKAKNQGEDRRELYLYADYSSRKSVIFDGATRYMAGEVKLADQRSNGYVILAMPFNINVDAQLSFPNVPEAIDTLQAIEFWIYADRSYSPFKFEGVPVLNE